MWSWKQTNVQVSQSLCTWTEHGHWLNSRKVKYSILGVDEIFFLESTKNPSLKSHSIR